jgi:hypothetical protein
MGVGACITPLHIDKLDSDGGQADNQTVLQLEASVLVSNGPGQHSKVEPVARRADSSGAPIFGISSYSRFVRESVRKRYAQICTLRGYIHETDYEEKLF